MTRFAALLGFVWAVLTFSLFLYAVVGADPATDCGPEGTDWYYECTTSEPIDLTIQDEAQTLQSAERN